MKLKISDLKNVEYQSHGRVVRQACIQLDNQVWRQVSDQFWVQVRNQVINKVNMQGYWQVYNQVRSQIYEIKNK